MLEVHRSPTESELRAWRRDLKKGQQRGVATSHSRHATAAASPTADGRGADFHKSERPKVSVRDVYKETLDHVMQWSKKSREDYQQIVTLMRNTNPLMIAHLTDEQAIDTLEEAARKKVKDAVELSMRRAGREHDLAARLDWRV